MNEKALRTLVVEDEAVTRRLLHEVLVRRGHEVEACVDAETGWSSFERRRPDLVLLDLHLPDSNGLELCRRIRRDPGEDEPVVLLVTASEESAALEGALEAGADDYLLKPVNDDDLPVRLSIAERRIRDRRQRRQIEAHLRRDALHDPVTGLANRTFLRERIEQSIRRRRREEGYLFALVVLDLANVRSLDRRLDREVADRLLDEVGRRIESCVRSIDTVARLEGDRFAILLDGVADVSDPSRVATRALEALSSPFDAPPEAASLAARAGIALSAAGYQRPEEILQDAHSALEQARTEGPGSYRIHDPVTHVKALARIELESRLRRAIEEDEMELRYQPIVALDDGRVQGFEALLRWHDPERGPVDPGEFIAAAEGTDLILSLGSWVLDRVVDQLDAWTRGASDPAAYVSVNLSGEQFLEPDLADRIADRLDRGPVDGRSLHVEITEASLTASVETAERVLDRLSQRGVRVQVDDFGTGYSSLGDLARFPIDALKIDRSFVRRMAHGPENLEVVRTMVRVGRNLGLTLIAEGIEAERELELLRELGCDQGQGFLFSRPVSADEAGRILRDPVIV